MLKFVVNGRFKVEFCRIYLTVTPLRKSLVILFPPDYETLRTTGVILAVVMFVSGILIALSKFSLFFNIPIILRL